jgi:hypothetical protein
VEEATSMTDNHDTKGAPSGALAILISLSLWECAKPIGECDVMCPAGERVDTSVCACVSAGDGGAAVDASRADVVDAGSEPPVTCGNIVCQPNETCNSYQICCPPNGDCAPVSPPDAGGE